MRRIGAALLLAAAAAAAPSKYLEDFEFIRDTVKREGAAVKSKKIDWKRACARLRPAFAACESDADHVRNVMRLLAVLRDSHTGVTRHSAGRGLPSKWDGLYGGGLWIGWDRGLCFLQGLMEGHSLTGVVPLGSALVAIDGEPAWLAMERERRRITAFQGASTDHSLFCSMDNRFLPFGEKQSVEIVFLTPEGKTKKAQVARWGPGGKAFYPSEATLPDGVKWAEGALSAWLPATWSKKVGYLRITGSMDEATVRAFHAALDRLEGMEAMLLDCRRMGGGGDDAAWEMAGRFFPKGVSNGLHGRISASGAWQFDGPVVMLQDETEVSSAETFTWAMCETERCVSVGRPTGGWGIIPKGFSCPSGLVSFRLGVNDRPTPIRRIHTEGVGWPPDVLVPYGPVLCARPDPVREIGLEILRRLHEGASRKDAVAAIDDPGSDLGKLARDDLKARLAMERALLKLDDAPPDALGASVRLEGLADRAKAAGVKRDLARLEKALRAAKGEIAAQRAFLDLPDPFAPDDADRKHFLARHKRSAIARWAADHLWK